jgi:hypothetical protein
MSGRPEASRRREVLPVTLADRLRALARRIERLGVSGRTDPEAIVVEKLSVARDLRQLAQEQSR